MNLKEWNELTEGQKYYVCTYQKFSEKFIKQIWNGLTEDQKDYVCIYQKLPEKFVKQIWDELTEDQKISVCTYQKLSETFIKEVWSELTEGQKDYVCRYQNISEKFIKQIWSELTEVQQELITDIHESYPSKKERIERAKKYAKKHNLEIKGKHLYAFRNHSKWGRGMYSYTTFYKKGEMYEDWHCDPRRSELDSFGLGVFPRGNTLVRVPLDRFVVEVNRKDGKSRVEAFEMV